MNKLQMCDAITAKVNELEATIVAMEANLKLSECTVRTQKYQKTHEIHNLKIMLQLLTTGELTGDCVKWFESTVTLTATRRGPVIEFHDGDDLLKIMDAHPNKAYKDLKKMLQDQGFHLDGHTVRK